MKFLQLLDEIGGRSAFKPIAPKHFVLQRVEQTEGIEDVGRRRSEMVTVVLAFEQSKYFFSAFLFLFSKFVQIVCHLRADFLFADAADGCKRWQHGDVLQIVQLAEDAKLRELGDAREENKMQMGVAVLQRRVEVAHDLAQLLQLFFSMYYI